MRIGRIGVAGRVITWPFAGFTIPKVAKAVAETSTTLRICLIDFIRTTRRWSLAFAIVVPGV